jgi:hypothetical protein
MPRRGYFIGKLVTGWYEVGRTPSAFHKQRGFPYLESVVELPGPFVEGLWDVKDMKSGEVRKVFRRGGGLFIRELTEKEKEKYYEDNPR